MRKNRLIFAGLSFLYWIGNFTWMLWTITLGWIVWMSFPKLHEWVELLFDKWMWKIINKRDEYFEKII